MNTVARINTTCGQCGREVPPLDFCLRCGFPLEGAKPHEHRNRRSRYAAAPNEQAWSIHMISTLFPQLPRGEMPFFNLALVLGFASVLGLGLGGLYPIALTAAAVLVPLLVLMYLYSVDIFEDEPIRVVGLTMAWGAVAGTALGVMLQNVGTPLGPLGLHLLTESDVVVRGIVFPLVGLVLVLIGPLMLLRYRRFNDVLDGVTFGAATAVTLFGSQTLAQAWPLVSDGLRPPGDTSAWVFQLVVIGLLIPLVWAGAVGLLAGALWLRFRAPVRDRKKLGALGSPLIALALAAVLLVAATTGLQVLERVPALIWVAALAAVSVVLLRRGIHLGLLEEADEIDIGPEIVCVNCGRTTPLHTFCGRCGIALRALPKVRPIEERSIGRPDGVSP